MSNKKIRNIAFIVILAAAVAAGWRVLKREKSPDTMVAVMPVRGTVENVVTTTGTVLPMNRLEIKPPVNGRLEEILVKEGQKVKSGQVIAWMSSTERAALLDAARGKDDGSFKYWQEVYKPIALVAPIEGEVIVAKTQPGQAIVTGDAVIVLSDVLIARAQVDETDIGKVKEGQEAVIALDAYPETRIQGKAQHIYYESKTVNNVTIYEVDVVPQEGVPGFFRSGMNTSIDFKVEARSDALLLPQEAVQQEGAQAWILVGGAAGAFPERRQVRIGISDGKNIEITSGLKEGETVLIRTKKYNLPRDVSGTNPFMPNMRRR